MSVSLSSHSISLYTGIFSLFILLGFRLLLPPIRIPFMVQQEAAGTALPARTKYVPGDRSSL